MRLFCIVMFILFTSCDFAGPTFATDEQRKEAMDNAKFDERIIVNILTYDNLKEFLLKYSDTIISYRNSKNYVVEIGGANEKDTIRQKSDCYNFFQGNSIYDITNVPDFLKLKLDSIYNAIGDHFMRSFKVCRDKKIEIEVRSEGGENGLYISHNLIWNGKVERDYAYDDNKDTILSENCIYRIGMTEEHGH